MTEEQHGQAPAETDEPTRTGIAGVDAVLEEVDRAADLPVAERVAVFERAHEQLRRALDDAPAGPSGDVS
jgi:hypothetical protein